MSQINSFLNLGLSTRLNHLDRCRLPYLMIEFTWIEAHECLGHRYGGESQRDSFDYRIFIASSNNSPALSRSIDELVEIFMVKLHV